LAQPIGEAPDDIPWNGNPGGNPPDGEKRTERHPILRSVWRRALVLLVPVTLLPACLDSRIPSPVRPPPASDSDNGARTDGTPHLALWLAKKDELIAHPDARYDLILTGWFEPAEAEALKRRDPSANLLAGLSHTWIFNNPEWQRFLITIANGGDPHGPLQITDDMYLMIDVKGDGSFDQKCSPPGWGDIFAMDPRDPAWRKIIFSFYETVARQPQHDGVVIDMLDAYAFCEGGRSGGVPAPIDAAAWVSAQTELLEGIRDRTPDGKWVFANAGHDFPAGSPFPPYLNGYLLENFLGGWGASLEEGLASARRALKTTRPPHVVVFAVDTDDTGAVDWARFRMGFAAGFLLDNTLFAFDYGSRDHGGVADWWFPDYFNIDLGKPLGPYSQAEGGYCRDFAGGTVAVAAKADMRIAFPVSHTDPVDGRTAMEFTVPQGDARIFLRSGTP
jgi:hypothetical protein